MQVVSLEDVMSIIQQVLGTTNSNEATEVIYATLPNIDEIDENNVPLKGGDKELKNVKIHKEAFEDFIFADKNDLEKIVLFDDQKKVLEKIIKWN